MRYTVYQHSVNNIATDKAATMMFIATDKAVATFSSYTEAEQFIARQHAQESRFAVASRDIFSYYIK